MIEKKVEVFIIMTEKKALTRSPEFLLCDNSNSCLRCEVDWCVCGWGRGVGGREALRKVFF